MAGTLLGVGASMNNKADLVCCVPSGCQLSSGRDRLGTRWLGCPEQVRSEGEDAYCAGAGNLCGADSLGGLLGASIVYIETWGPKETSGGAVGAGFSAQGTAHGGLEGRRVACWRSCEVARERSEDSLGSESKA